MDGVKRITIKDVAQTAGVSIATVSRILNGQSGVSKELVLQVEAAVKQLNYQPNEVARALKIRESRSVGLIIPDIENPFFPSLVRGVEDAAEKSGYALILCNTDGKAEEEEKYVKFLLSKQIDGILFAGNMTIEQWNLRLPGMRVPIVLLDRPIQGAPFSRVVIDNELGAFMAVEHLFKAGRQRIAIITGRPHSTSSKERFAGYVKALGQYGKAQQLQLWEAGDFTFKGGYTATEKLLADSRSFDGIFACNDLMAIGAIECLLKHGYKVPEDVAVVGFDNIKMASWYKPSLSTIDQPVYEMGQLAVDMLIRHINKETDQATEAVIKPKLIIRQSSGGEDGNNE